MHPRAPSYANKSNDPQRPHKCGDGKGCKYWYKIRYEWKRTRTGHIYKRLHKDVFFFSIFGLLRQVWTCIGREKCTIGFLLSRRMEIKSHLIASHLALKKSAYIRPFRGVVQLFSRMDACIFNCCSVLHSVLRERALTTLENWDFNCAGEIIVHHCQVSYILMCSLEDACEETVHPRGHNFHTS